MVSRACNRFLNIVFDLAEIFNFQTFPSMLSQRWHHFSLFSGSDEMRSAHTQPVMKFVPRMLSIFWMMILKWVVSSPYAEHACQLITLWPWACTKKLLVGWACVKIGYSLDEHARKSFRHTTCIFRIFPLFLLSPILLSPSPSGEKQKKDNILFLLVGKRSFKNGLDRI